MESILLPGNISITFPTLIILLLVVFLFIYLFVALFYPERFI